MLFKLQDKSSPPSYTHYAMLYPQNGDRIVAIDSVTSPHPVYTCAKNWLSTNRPSFAAANEVVTLMRVTASCNWADSWQVSPVQFMCCKLRSFHSASPRLWNQLPASLRQPCTDLSNSASPSSLSGTSSISSIDSPLSSPITPSLFHSRLKTFLFCKSFPL